MKKFFAICLVVFALTAFVVPAVSADANVAPVAQDEAPLDLTGLLQDVGQFVLGSVVIAAAATFVVNTGKDVGFVSDSQSVTWVSTINFILIVGVFFLKLFNPDFDLGVIERVADSIVRHGPGFILPLMPLLIKFSKWIHEAVKGAKWIGTSYTLASASASSAKKK